ncbi:MAG: hypothetical protein IPL62_09560 [Caulobacteraceae bacterium]|nr:hypothetical protein [Caulobacteraceae bacterium]
MRRLLLSLAFALSAPPAFAQGTEEEPQAAPGSIAIGMIEQVDGDGIFDLVHDGAVTVRHTRSGLICHFLRNGDGGRLIIFNPPTDPAHSAEITIPRGDDVACEMEEGGAHIRYFATRYPFGSTLTNKSQALKPPSAAETPMPRATQARARVTPKMVSPCVAPRASSSPNKACAPTHAPASHASAIGS